MAQVNSKQQLPTSPVQDIFLMRSALVGGQCGKAQESALPVVSYEL